MNRKIILGLCSGIAIGLIVCFLVMTFFPRATIYDRLRDLKLNYQIDIWDAQRLENAESIIQFRTLEQLTVLENETLSLDSSYNVIWFSNEGNPSSLLFYCYTEPD